VERSPETVAGVAARWQRCRSPVEEDDQLDSAVPCELDAVLADEVGAPIIPRGAGITLLVGKSGARRRKRLRESLHEDPRAYPVPPTNSYVDTRVAAPANFLRAALYGRGQRAIVARVVIGLIVLMVVLAVTFSAIGR
jgi:hypothetical protein